MKKITLLLSLLVVSLIVFSQQVERNWVLVEIATGTWCGYCPGAAMAADDLIANGHQAAILENHNGDDFTTPDSDGRNSYYNVTGYPTTNFDGSYDNHVGGNSTQSIYDIFYPIVDARIVMDADFTLEIFGVNNGDEYTITTRLQNVGGYEDENLALRFALTESEIQYSWQGQSVLNFVNRLMLPDHNGTDLSSYDLNDLTTIELPFTFDNSWDSQHCEILVFIQDDDSKEVLQSQKVALLDLESPLSADFIANATVSCAGSTINFDDASAGEDITTWNWVFEGGTPATSTEQNPEVTYSNTGSFDVELTVTDPSGTSTTIQPDFITILETPVQADAPEGEDVICSGFYYSYSTPEVAFTQSYEWELIPESVGILTVNDNMATIDAADDWTGDFTLRVRATNICGDGEWSETLNGSLYQSPEVFSTEGGGGYCAGGDGVEITLSGSQTGIEYELYFEGDPTGNILPGTGSALSFGMLTEAGFYSVSGYSANCTSLMMEQVEVYQMFPPAAPGTPNGPDAICNNDITEYTSNGSDDAETYEWVISPEEAGTITANELVATVEWNTAFSGTASISLYGVNGCGDGSPSEAFEVAVDAIPAPVIEGLELVCDNDITEYSTTENEGSTFTWEVIGGTITDGQGTYMVTVEWGEAGTGQLNLTEETANGCLGNANAFDVTIDECTSLEELSGLVVTNVYPNPATDKLNIEIKANSARQAEISIVNHLGQTVIAKSVEMNNEVKQTIDISMLSPGIYLLNVNNGNSKVIKQFIKE